jgi:hypothetical protein
MTMMLISTSVGEAMAVTQASLACMMMLRHLLTEQFTRQAPKKMGKFLPFLHFVISISLKFALEQNSRYGVIQSHLNRYGNVAAM